MNPRPHVIVIGAVNIDVTINIKAEVLMGVSNPANMSHQLGGVAANVSRVLCRDVNSVLLTTAGESSTLARQISQALEHSGVKHEFLTAAGSSGQYIAVLDPQGELILGLSDGTAIELLTPDVLASKFKQQLNPTLVAFDCNLSQAAIERITQLADRLLCVALAVSPAKIQRLSPVASKIDLLIGNRSEFATLASRPVETDPLTLVAAVLELGFSKLVMSDASHAIVVAEDNTIDTVSVPSLSQPVQSVNGAGDALAGGVIVGLCKGLTLQQSVRDHGLPAAQNILAGQSVSLD